MNSRIVTIPGVQTIAFTRFDLIGFEDWCADSGKMELAGDTLTPLGNISEIVTENNVASIDYLPEFAGRFCYDSFSKGRDSETYAANIRNEGHGSVLAHSSISFGISGVSRSLSHELVRHGIGTAISQESQRYVDMSKARFVLPPIMTHLWGGNTSCSEAEDWFAAREAELAEYNTWQIYLTDILIDQGHSTRMARKLANEAARSVLPNAIETKMTWTGNLRALRHIVSLRGSVHADIEIRQFAGAILKECKRVAPMNFADINFEPLEEAHFGVPIIYSENPKV
jgi:thymidylate synthase (FAD)